MSEKASKCRINAYISKKNYKDIDEFIDKEHLISMTLSKGAVLDVALSTFFNAIKCGESLENLTIQHLERVEDANIDNAIAGDDA